MSGKKEKAPHEKVIDHIYSKDKAKDAYLFATKFEHEDVLHTAKSSIVDKMGSKKAYSHLKTSKGQDEFGDVGAKRLEELALKKYGIDKSKVHEFDLSRLVENTYGVNKDILKEFIRNKGPEFDFADYREDFLDKHLKQIDSHITQNHVLNYDPEHTPAVLKHIGADKYIRDLDTLKDDRYKPLVASSVLNWNKGGKPLGKDYFKNNEAFSLFLKDQYKDWI